MAHHQDQLTKKKLFEDEAIEVIYRKLNPAEASGGRYPELAPSHHGRGLWICIGIVFASVAFREQLLKPKETVPVEIGIWPIGMVWHAGQQRHLVIQGFASFDE